MQSVKYCQTHNEPVVFYDEHIEDPKKTGLCLLCIQKLINKNNIVTIDQHQKVQQELINKASEEIDECSKLLKQLLQSISSYQQIVSKNLDKLMIMVKEQINLFQTKKDYFLNFLALYQNSKIEILKQEYENKQEIQSQVKCQLNKSLIELQKLTNVDHLFKLVDQLKQESEQSTLIEQKKEEIPDIQSNDQIKSETFEEILQDKIETEEMNYVTEQYEEDKLEQFPEINTSTIQQNENKYKSQTALKCYSTIDNLDIALESNIKGKSIICKFCSQEFEIVDEIKQKCCVNCSNKKCSRCQNEQTQIDDLVMIEGKTVCKNCLKCNICGKLNADKISGYYYYHKKCFEFISKSKLKAELLSLIQNKLHTIEHKGEINQNLKYFIFEKFECLQLQNYTGYIYGYHHVLYKNPKAQIDPKGHKIVQQKAKEYLFNEFEQAEVEVIKQFIQRGNPNVSGIPENIKLLLAFANFILKDLSSFSSQFAKPNYPTLYHDLNDLKCFNKAKHQCTIKGKINIGLEFFNHLFHRVDGKVREKTIMSKIKQLVPLASR